MTNDRVRLAAWCFVMSIITAVCLWILVGSPETRTKGVWRFSSHELAARK